MIRYLLHSEIDKFRWDETVSQCGNIYAFSWYLDIVHPNWSALVDGDYEAIMPLTGGKKFGVEYLFQPFFVQQLGVFSKQDLTRDKINNFLAAIPKKFRFAEFRLNEGNCIIGDAQGIECHRNVILDLNKDYDMIRSAYHNNTKRNLAKAESNRLQLVEDADAAQVIALFRNDRGGAFGQASGTAHGAVFAVCGCGGGRGVAGRRLHCGEDARHGSRRRDDGRRHRRT